MAEFNKLIKKKNNNKTSCQECETKCYKLYTQLKLISSPVILLIFQKRHHMRSYDSIVNRINEWRTQCIIQIAYISMNS